MFADGVACAGDRTGHDYFMVHACQVLFVRLFVCLQIQLAAAVFWTSSFA
jgi:hypothetical protein